MADYIDRAALIKELSESVEPFNTGSVFRAINRQPAADVAPVRHGRWIIRRGPDWPDWPEWAIRIVCSECGLVTGEKSKYCPNCGAKMDLEDENG